MDRLDAIALFARAVETGSFSEAGRQSGIAPSSVSRRIVELEAWIGAVLFHRTTRKLTLTEAGRAFYDRTQGVLLDLEEARVIAGDLEDRPAGILRLTAPSSLEPHLTTAVGDFQAQWAEVTVALAFTDRIVDIVGEGFDLAIRMGGLTDSTLRTRKIGAARRFLCASPDYLRHAGTPARPQDLTDHACLIFRSHPGYNVWRFASESRGIDVRASGRLCADNGNALINAARRGMGLVLAPEWLVGSYLTKGELVEVLPDYPPAPKQTPLYALHPYQRFVPPKVKSFSDFLARRFARGYDWAEARNAPLP